MAEPVPKRTLFKTAMSCTAFQAMSYWLGVTDTAAICCLTGCELQNAIHTLHLSLGVDNDTSIVLKIDEYTILSPPWLSLTDHNSWHNCRAQNAIQLM